MKIINSTIGATYALPLIVDEVTIERGYLVEIITGDTEISDTDYDALQRIPYFQERIALGDYVIEILNKNSVSPSPSTIETDKI